MKKPLLLDTNIFLRHWLADDEVQAEHCSRLLAAVEAGKYKAVVPPIVFAEIAWVLQSFYRLDKSSVLAHLESITQTRNINTKTDSDILQALSYYQQYNVKWTDCLILSCLSEGMVLCSYDKEFDRIKTSKRVSPGELV